MTGVAAAAADPEARHGWIGRRPSLVEQVAMFAVGIAGVMFAGVGPLLLGGLQAGGRLSAVQLGQAGTVELLSMGVAAALAGPVIGVGRLRLVGLACGLALGLLNIATTQVAGDMLTLVRGLAGLPSGVMIWLITGMIVRSPRPERWSGLYFTLQTLGQLIVVAAVSALILKPFGVDGGFLCLAGISLAAGLAALAGPAAYDPLHDEDVAPGGLPGLRGWVALAAAFIFQAFILAAWIYVEPLSRQSGHPAGTAGLAISLSLAAQVVGGTAATIIAGRLSWFMALVGSVAGMILLLGVFHSLPGAPIFLGASAAFGFLWMFASPYLTPLAIEADPTRRAAMLGPGAGLLGCSAGPFLASLLVTDTDVRGGLVLAGALAVACLAIIIGLHLTRGLRAANA